MQCKVCIRNFNDKERTPRILIGCGHTVCEECIGKALTGNQITCVDCGAVSEAKQPTDFPKNLILMGVKPEAKPKLPEIQATCITHNKQLEAFCEKEKVLVCIDCILTNGHKNHEICPILQSSEIEKEKLKKSNEECLKLDEEIKMLTNTLETYRCTINEKANKMRENITSLFNDIQNAVHERESQLKQDISSVLEKEEDMINEKLVSIEQHKISSDIFKNEISKLDYEDSISVLHNVIERQSLAKEATKPLPSVPQNVAFPELSREKEINNIIRLLNPAKPNKNNIHNDTISSSRRKIDAMQKPKKYSKNNPKKVNEIPQTKLSASNLNLLVEHNKFNKMVSPKKEKTKVKTLGNEFLACTSPQPLKCNEDVTLATLNLQLCGNNSFSRIDEYKTNSKNTSQENIFKDLSILGESTSKMCNNINKSTNLLKERREQFKEHKNRDADIEKQAKLDNLEEITRSISNTEAEIKKMQIPDKVKSILEKVEKIEKEENRKDFEYTKPHSKKDITSPAKPTGDLVQIENRKESSIPSSEICSNAKSKYSITPSMYEQMINTDSNCDYQNLFASLSQFIYVFSGMQKNGLISCEKFDISKGIWKECKPMSKARTKFASVSTIDSKVLILGGKYINAHRTDEIEMYDPILDEWSTFPMKLHKGKSSFAALSDGMGVYVCGGSDGTVLSSFHYMDITAKEWKGLPDMITKREELGFTYGPDKKIYAIGGYNGKECLKSAERYNIEAKKWEPIASMNTARRSLCAVALPDGIYVMGGYDGAHYLNSCERYDEKSNKWVFVKSMNNPRCTMAAVSSPDSRYIYVLGGFYDSEPLRFVERYDVMSDKWEIITPMKNKRFMHSAVIMMLSNYEEKAGKI